MFVNPGFCFGGHFNCIIARQVRESYGIRSLSANIEFEFSLELRHTGSAASFSATPNQTSSMDFCAAD
jgi:hypothetical protein